VRYVADYRALIVFLGTCDGSVSFANDILSHDQITSLILGNLICVSVNCNFQLMKKGAWSFWLRQAILSFSSLKSLYVVLSGSSHWERY